MPRLPRLLLRTAFAQNPLLPILLKECRTLEQATAELRWLREHALEKPTRPLAELCERRGRGEPLQYILGTQPFGGLEILCRKNVLIPRSETEHLTSHLFSQLLSHAALLPRPLRVLDLCTGTGCISLHLHALLSAAHISSVCTGIDIAPAAVHLARANRYHNIDVGLLPPSASTHVTFALGNVLRPDGILPRTRVDVVVANPPYISQRGFEQETARSVRNYEPRLALLGGGAHGDQFYPAVARVAGRMGARVMLVEVGGSKQAKRIRDAWALSGKWEGVQVWLDYAGKGRGVVAWREGWEWVRDGPTTVG